MSKKDQYGLDFLKITSGDTIGYNCIRKDGIVDNNNLLQFISYLNVSDTQKLIDQIEAKLDNRQSTLNVQFFDHIDLDFQDSQLVIDSQPHTFPLADIKELLEEWLVFLQS